MTTRAEIVAEARRYALARTPWRRFGRTAQGLDCAGLLVVVGRDLGLPVGDDVTEYVRGEAFVEKFRTAGFILRTDQLLRPGSPVLLHDKGQPCHCGVLGGTPAALTLIHATAARRMTIEESWSLWSSKLRCVLDYPGLED